MRATSVALKEDGRPSRSNGGASQLATPAELFQAVPDTTAPSKSMWMMRAAPGRLCRRMTSAAPSASAVTTPPSPAPAAVTGCGAPGST